MRLLAMPLKLRSGRIKGEGLPLICVNISMNFRRMRR